MQLLVLLLSSVHLQHYQPAFVFVSTTELYHTSLTAIAVLSACHLQCIGFNASCNWAANKGGKKLVHVESMLFEPFWFVVSI